MAAPRLRPKCRNVFALMAVALLVPVSVHAQSGSVTLQARVSETVDLSILPNSPSNGRGVDVVKSASSIIRITLSSEAESPIVRVPLVVRSNSAFKITAVFESSARVLTELSVIGVHPSGRLVSPNAVSGAVVTRNGTLDISQPLLVLSGPRVSLGGTLNSPNNALQITILIRLRPETGPRSSARLTLIGTAGPLTQ